MQRPAIGALRGASALLGLSLALLLQAASASVASTVAGHKGRHLQSQHQSQHQSQLQHQNESQLQRQLQHQNQSQLQSDRSLSSAAAGPDVHAAKVKHRLRVCNAYPTTEAVDIYHEKDRITDTPMLYKTCGEFAPMLKAGDRLQFEIGGNNAGSFAVSELPTNDAVLVLVIYRHDAVSSAVAFESHVFANLINAQIAVIDTYKGKAKASPRIQDAGDARTSRSEELRYDSVVAVNPGTYEVVLQSENGETKARRELVALNRESYIVVRCGVEAHEGRSYSQDLIVFPHSDPQALMGAAGRQARPLLAAVGLAVAAVLASVVV